jgi:hypothetical protein
VQKFFETADIARCAGITPELVRRDAAEGRLNADAVTERGCRLFGSKEVRRYLAEREVRCRARKERQKGRDGRSRVAMVR